MHIRHTLQGVQKDTLMMAAAARIQLEVKQTDLKLLGYSWYAVSMGYVNRRLLFTPIFTHISNQVVYGFHIMVDPEGRKDLFYTLYERLPQHVLDKLVVVQIIL